MSSADRDARAAVHALLEGTADEGDVVARAASALLSTLGYDLPNARVRVRQNEQLVRAHASRRIAEAADVVGRLEVRHRAASAHPGPLPPPDVAARLRRLDALRRRLQDLASAIVAQPAEPPSSRGRADVPSLERLLVADLALVSAADELAAVVASLDPFDPAPADPAIARVEATLAERAAALP